MAAPTAVPAGGGPPGPSALSTAAEPHVRLLGRATGWVLAVGGAVGAVAALALILDRIALLKDPAYVPSCSISPLLSCGPVMASPQAELLGFPNPLIGLVAFPVVATTGVVVLTGAALPRWYWLALQGGATAGVVFVHWLIAASLYRIGALCPYCMAVWVVTIATFWYLTLHNLTTGRLPVPDRCRGVAAGLARYHSTVLAAWFLVIAAMIANAFWPYWVGLVAA
ncbi:vitamin K epoxide reductase family protein [Pseudonocardia xinjiangensis]|uniref:vitamin K epoxide reductase family protein n=1 Tax=Pseudonocardia xinjiangensis TaxID=75289 RepID=UPI003D8CE05B